MQSESMHTQEATTFDSGRRQFLQKTYAHLFGAIALFVLIEVILFQTGIIATVAPTLANNWLITLGGFTLVGWFASRFAGGDRPRSQQYLGLGLFVLAEALIFSPLLLVAVYYSDPSVLSSAIVTTLVIFAALSVYVFITKKDFSFLGPFLMIIGIAALLAIVGAVIFQVTLGFYFSLAMAVFAGAAVLYDTSKVMRGFRDDQYVAAALQLFSSIALLFYYILSIFISRR